MEKIIENLKRIVCFVLIVVSASFFAGCKKKKPTGNNEVVTEEETTPATEIIGLAYNNFYSMLNDESTFAEGDGKTFYDEYIFASMSILREVSLLSEIREDTVIFGREVEIQANEENYSDKVAKLYISDKITIKQLERF